jgi:signal transduction histidine kinase
MPGEPRPPKHSLRSRLLLLSGATFLLCAGVILMFFPLLNLTLEGLLERSITKMREAKEVEATTITRLVVLELSQVRELLEAKPGEINEVDQRIMNLIWVKVTFNEIIEGIELIQDQTNTQGQRLTYLFYRREAPDLKPMSGPQKILKKFSGAEKELLDGINSPQTIHKENLELSVNLGPKEEGQMMLRYLPVHILVPEEGAVFWGVAKIGVDVSGITALQAMQDQEKNDLRQAIWLEIILSLSISGILAVSLLYIWARSLTEPLRTLSSVARDFKTAEPQEYDLWLDNLRRVDPRGQTEVSELKETLIRLGKGVPRLGERLFASEYQACLSRVAARALPAIQADSALLRELQGDFRERCQHLLGRLNGDHPPQDRTLKGLPHDKFLLELEGPLNRLATELADWQHFAAVREEEWQTFDLTPTLNRAWRLVTLGLPPQARFTNDVKTLPPVWGSPGSLAQALLFLLDYAVEVLPSDGQLTLEAGPLPAGGLQMIVAISRPAFSVEACQDLLHPLKGDRGFQGSLGPALATAIAHWHGGELTAQPGDPQGLSFILKLPAPPTDHEDH